MKGDRLMSYRERFFLPTGGSALSAYRAFRAWAEGQAAARGQKLDPVWYQDGPEDLPELYEERPSSPAAESTSGSALPEPLPGHRRLPESPGAKAGGDDGQST
jgi:hypothetical protein